MFRFLLLLLIAVFSKNQAEQLELFAYNVNVKDQIISECPLCTLPRDYAATIAFTRNWKIFLWKDQAYLGRTLIVPFRHFGPYEEMNDEEALEYRQILKVLLPALEKTFSVTHFNVAYLMNMAYRMENPSPQRKDDQPNPHFHWHVIPRFNSPRMFEGETFIDPEFGNPPNLNRKQKMNEEFLLMAIEKIRENLKITYLVP